MGTTTSASTGAETAGASGTTAAGATSAATTSPSSTDTAGTEQGQSSKTWIYPAIGLVILVAAVTAVIALRRARSVKAPRPHS